jgi:hypothetical protein
MTPTMTLTEHQNPPERGSNPLPQVVQYRSYQLGQRHGFPRFRADAILVLYPPILPLGYFLTAGPPRHLDRTLKSPPAG